MNFPIQIIILGLSVLIFASIVLSKFTARLGVPTLLAFLGLGLMFGNGGPYDFHYDYPEFTLQFGQIALAIILFTGGLNTDYQQVRPVIAQSLSLSTLGVLLTTLICGVLIHTFTEFSFAQALLLGAIISSTDAAAVFSIVEAKQLKLSGKTMPTLEVESGTNDPMAYFLVISLTQLILTKEFIWHQFVGSLLYNLLLGVGIGWVMGWAIIGSMKYVKLKTGLNPVMILALVLFTFALAELLKANSLLAVYVAGIVFTKHPLRCTYSANFFEGVGWLMEILLFLALGLQVFVYELPPVIGTGLIVSAILILVARPLSVWVALSVFKIKWNEKAYIAWVGLRGATPIVFALYPVLYQVPEARLMFNLTFFVVLTSILIQGSSISLMAKWLKIS
ncbi:MAG: potassium/proton antiporter [Microscillaceae bacterium]|jgi:cell volume regulation protein A|nr:potassium/proton antiporter [Microscillaceae bacterium]